MVLHELFCFGLKQASACVFGGLLLALLLVSRCIYPADALLPRYDALTLLALALQGLMLASGMETREEGVVILLFHGVGMAMEVFKTHIGAWAYPEPSWLRLGGGPLFSGFMYAAVGSYLARAWRLFDFRFERHPPFCATVVLASAIYLNFFTHHVLPDARGLLFVATALLFGRCRVHFRVRSRYRQMPLLLGFVLVAGFIWLAENLGTWSHAWVYPSQRHGWQRVPLGKLGAWLLLMIISYVLVAAVHRRADRRAARRPVAGTGPAALQWPALPDRHPTEAPNVPEGLHDCRL